LVVFGWFGGGFWWFLLVFNGFWLVFEWFLVVFAGFNVFCCAFDAVCSILLKIVGPAEACLRGSHNFRYQQQDTAARWEDRWMLVAFWWFFESCRCIFVPLWWLLMHFGFVLVQFGSFLMVLYGFYLFLDGCVCVFGGFWCMLVVF